MEPDSVSQSDAKRLWSGVEFHGFEECLVRFALIWRGGGYVVADFLYLVGIHLVEC